MDKNTDTYCIFKYTEKIGAKNLLRIKTENLGQMIKKVRAFTRRNEIK